MPKKRSAAAVTVDRSTLSRTTAASGGPSKQVRKPEGSWRGRSLRVASNRSGMA
jgi:hypothetical protein